MGVPALIYPLPPVGKPEIQSNVRKAFVSMPQLLPASSPTCPACLVEMLTKIKKQHLKAEL